MNLKMTISFVQHDFMSTTLIYITPFRVKFAVMAGNDSSILLNKWINWSDLTVHVCEHILYSTSLFLLLLYCMSHVFISGYNQPLLLYIPGRLVFCINQSFLGQDIFKSTFIHLALWHRSTQNRVEYEILVLNFGIYLSWKNYFCDEQILDPHDIATATEEVCLLPPSWHCLLEIERVKPHNTKATNPFYLGAISHSILSIQPHAQLQTRSCTFILSGPKIALIKY
ncbi:hypothetical protein ACJX0J_014692 [Zea mays]